MGILPSKKPQLTPTDVEYLLSTFHDIEQYPVKLLGVRGYFKNIEGGHNQIGIYDDAIFISAPNHFVLSYNANTDPSRQYTGVATLKAGGPYLYKKGLHGVHHLNLTNAAEQKIYDQLISTKKDVPGYTACYWALRQYSNVTVIRDGKEQTDTQESRFWIDIHRGGVNTTSSAGCNTIPPNGQWEDFFTNVCSLMEKNNQTIIPYCLTES